MLRQRHIITTLPYMVITDNAEVFKTICPPVQYRTDLFFPFPPPESWGTFFCKARICVPGVRRKVALVFPSNPVPVIKILLGERGKRHLSVTVQGRLRFPTRGAKRLHAKRLHGECGVKG